MSSYLNFYLVPKKKEGMTEEPKPLCFTNYSRNSSVYKAFDETLNPTCIGIGDEPNYSELSPGDVKEVIDNVKGELQQAKDRFESRKRAYRELANQIPEEAIDDFVSTEEYIKELEDGVHAIEGIYDWVYDLEYSDFEKVLINIS